jgi:hypothetical protein
MIYSNCKRGGYVFLMGLFALVICMILGVSTIRVASNYQYSTSRQQSVAEALQLADAAINTGQALLRVRASTLRSTLRYPASGTISMATGSYWVQIEPVSNDINAWVLNYKITGTGTATRFGIEKKIVIFLCPRSFSQYGFFEDTGINNYIWKTDISSIHGPFHSNGNGGTRQVNVEWLKNDSRDPYDPSYPYIFYDTASTVCSDMNWGASGKPTTDAQWHKIFAGGQAALRTSAEAIPFPTTATEQRDTAYGGTPPTPAQTNMGVFLKSTVSNAGIYINSFDQPVTVVYSVGASGEQVVTINHNIRSGSKYVSKITEITINLANNTTSTRTKTGTKAFTGSETLPFSISGSFTSPTLQSGIPNGVLYCTGAINGVNGVLADNYIVNNKIARSNFWTISSDITKGTLGNITIANNLTYLHEPDFALPMTHANNVRVPAMGIIANQIRIKGNITPDNNYDHVAHPDRTAKDLIINGVLMGFSQYVNALNQASIYVEDIANSKLMGDICILGGSVVKSTAVHGTISNGVLQYGYSKRYTYDPRMADGPLTAFPSTNQFNVLSWQVTK